MVFAIEETLYSGTLMNESILTKLFFFLSQVFFNIIIGVLYLYVKRLHDRMNSTITQNMKLLNGMHEGVLILSKEDASVMFCNKPA